MAEPESEQLVASRMGQVAGFASKLRENAFNSVKEASGTRASPSNTQGVWDAAQGAAQAGAAPAELPRHPTRRRHPPVPATAPLTQGPADLSFCCRPSPGPS